MKFRNEEELEEVLSAPSEELIEDLKSMEGDLLFLGVAGKMGMTMAVMAKRAMQECGKGGKVYGASLFESEKQRKKLEEKGIPTFEGDLMDPGFLQSLPDAEQVIFLAGQKFGTEGREPFTWAINSYLPGLIAERYKDSRIVVLSTGCVYPLVPTSTKGSSEKDIPEPVGEYAQSCLGRERLFQYGSVKYKTPVTIVRLYYSVEMRYGVLVDIATQVLGGTPIDLSMGHANVIWQGDANNMILRSLKYCESPAKILNICGPEIFSVRTVAEEFGRLMGKSPHFTGTENSTALLGDGRQTYELLGMPSVALNQIIEWTAEWMLKGGELLGKPTHFEVRDGKY